MDDASVDVDVAAEKKKILTMGDRDCAKQNSVVLSGLTKIYGVKKVVNSIYVVVPNGECFGLLGAFHFKTTRLKITYSLECNLFMNMLKPNYINILLS